MSPLAAARTMITALRNRFARIGAGGVRLEGGSQGRQMSEALKRDRLRAALLSIILFAALTPAMNQPHAEVTGDEERNIERLAVKRVQPPYPPMAQKYKIEGAVTVQVTVEKDGRVSKAEFVRGHNIFRSVSLDAAKRWEFKRPDSDNLQGTIHFIFKLNE